ncbi:MAG: hypothetical protein IT536_08450 [Hyphomicrobiales bacterium]|nr:hypothetical protein [Hyphomicrobiales bacterium]
MNLLITYLLTVSVGIVGVAWLSVIVDRMTSPFISLLVFFPLMFGAIWVMWRLSIKLTEPKSTTP